MKEQGDEDQVAHLPAKGLMDLHGVKLADSINLNQDPLALGCRMTTFCFTPPGSFHHLESREKVMGGAHQRRKVIQTFGGPGSEGKESRARSLSLPPPGATELDLFPRGQLALREIDDERC